MHPTKLKIKTFKSAEELCRKWKDHGQVVVFTNGCFDILHLGHIDYLEKARNLGDKLIVGINTDESVQRLKGSERPINPGNARFKTIAALDFVDAVVPFEEETPEHLIGLLIPDVLVKGNDYKIDNIVGADIVMKNGGKVETIELVNGYSTSGLIEKIKKLKS